MGGGGVSLPRGEKKNVSGAGAAPLRFTRPQTKKDKPMLRRPAARATHALQAAARRYAADSVPPRDPSFARLTPEDVVSLTAAAGGPGPSAVTDAPTLARFNTDWTGAFRGASSLALRPATVGAASAILAYCNARLLAIVPQGGNTGLLLDEFVT